MCKYASFLEARHIKDIKTLSALSEHYIKHDDRLDDDVKKRLLEVSLLVEKMFDVNQTDLESVYVSVETYTKQDTEELRQLEKNATAPKN